MNGLMPMFRQNAEPGCIIMKYRKCDEQRRNQSGLLIQGSLQPVPGGVDRDVFAAALRTVASRDWHVGWEMMPASRWEAQARELVATRYEDEGYHRRR